MGIAPLALAEIADVLQGNCPDFTVVQGITTDTRTLQAGEVFVALKGERFDGHQFIPQAIAQGAIAVVVSEPVGTQPVPVFTVPNTLVAYQQLAQHWRRRFAIPIIGITGSVGKTTTKEIIAAVLGTAGNVHKTQKNFNNEIGVPKTLLGLQPEHDYAVVEMAMRGRGEIALLAEIAEPTIGLITNVGTAHIGRLGSEQAIAAAKCELLTHMPATSLAILNADNARLMKTAAQVWSGRTITYGLTQGDFRGEWRCAENTLCIEGKVYPLPLPGEHIASNYLAALAVAQAVGLDWQQLAGQQLTVHLPAGRSRQVHLAQDVCLLDETYNAGYESMVAALKLLKNTPGSRHLAVLGAMKELGNASVQLHGQVGEWVAQLGLDALFVLVDDPEAAAIATTAAPVPTTCCATPEELSQALLATVQPGDRILFKASNSVGLERIVQQISQTWGQAG